MSPGIGFGGRRIDRLTCRAEHSSSLALGRRFGDGRMTGDQWTTASVRCAYLAAWDATECVRRFVPEVAQLA